MMMMAALVNQMRNALPVRTIPLLIAKRMNALAILMRNAKFVVY